MRKLSDTLTYILDRPTYLNENNMELRETYDNIPDTVLEELEKAADKLDDKRMILDFENYLKVINIKQP